MRNRIAGLSLVELMVAVGIVGILATIAMPRYQAFMVQSRRGEAKSNLSHIISLQEAYKIDYFKYYSGNPMTGSNGIGYRYHTYSSSHSCGTNDEDLGLCNHLGFRPDAASELRYLYRVTNQGSRAVAGAASDSAGRWIYPDCNGGGASECGSPTGDVVSMNVNGTQQYAATLPNTARGELPLPL